MSIVELWRLWRLRRRLEREVRMGWQWEIAAKKAGITLAKNGISVLVAAACLVPDSSAHQWLIASGFPPELVAALVPILMALVRYYGNRAKHAAPPEDKP